MSTPSMTSSDSHVNGAPGAPGETGAASGRSYYRFRPLNLGRGLVWGLFALVLVLAPHIFRSSLALTMLSQFGYMIIVCLSYNLLLGQGGMLSFGHAVYTGLGAFFAIHAMNLAGQGTIPIPLWLIPLVGGVAGFAVAALLGFPSTKKAGTPFAMITMGVGELVFAMSLMFPEFFGGEGGVTSNRVYGQPFLGITFGPQIQVYYLIATYCFICTAAMFAFTRTPLGRMLNAVRDNPERVAFVGYNTQYVRYLSFMIAGFFAGIAGGLAAINFEIVTAETVSGIRSGGYLLFTFLGGATFFFGPIIGAILLVLSLVMLSEITKAWQIYLGFVFLFMVMYAPGGFASLVMMNLRVASFGKLKAMWKPYAAVIATGLTALVALAAVVELMYHRQMDASMGTPLKFIGLSLDSSTPATWGAVLIVAAATLVAFEWTRRRFVLVWGKAQEEIEIETKRREALG